MELKTPKILKKLLISSVGKILYSRFVDNYSKKMWRVNSNKSIDIFGWSPKGVTIKEGAREAWDVAISVTHLQKMVMTNILNLQQNNVKVY